MSVSLLGERVEQRAQVIFEFEGSLEAAKELLDRAESLAVWARRIKADTEAINAIQEGKLLIVARLGELLPRGEPGRHELVSLITGTYREMPGLSLRLPEAARLFGLRELTCKVILEDLVRQGRLRLTHNGQYISA